MGLPRGGTPLGVGLSWLAGLVTLAACSSGSLVLGRLDDASTPAVDAGDDAALCDPPPPTRHYAFDGTGTEVADVRGGDPAHLVGGATLDGTGVLRLDGVDDYVDLPNGVLAGLTEVTVAVWVRRMGGPAYTRLFDIGTAGLGEDPPAGSTTGGTSYLACTPGTGHTPSGLAVLMSNNGPVGESVAVSDIELDAEMHLVVVVVSNDTLSLFYEGNLAARVARPFALSEIVDNNVWLGRSQYSSDAYLTAEYADFRIFDRALPDCAVRALYTQGPAPP